MALGFEHPFTCIIAGPTKSGKTVFVQKLLQAAPYYITPSPTRIIWITGTLDKQQNENIQYYVPQHIEFTNQLPDIELLSSDDKNLLIIDDYMNDAGKNNTVANLFTKGCHHQNISVILILQNLFHQGRYMRDIHTSTNYLILYKNPRDKTQINHLSRQCFPENAAFLKDAYNHACSTPFGYIILDFCQTTPDQYRVSSGIFPPDVSKVYIPRTKKLGL